jgi:hypothetical protein
MCKSLLTPQCGRLSDFLNKRHSFFAACLFGGVFLTAVRGVERLGFLISGVYFLDLINSQISPELHMKSTFFAKELSFIPERISSNPIYLFCL